MRRLRRTSAGRCHSAGCNAESGVLRSSATVGKVRGLVSLDRSSPATVYVQSGRGGPTRCPPTSGPPGRQMPLPRSTRSFLIPARASGCFTALPTYHDNDAQKWTGTSPPPPPPPPPPTIEPSQMADTGQRHHMAAHRAWARFRFPSRSTLPPPAAAPPLPPPPSRG